MADYPGAEEIEARPGYEHKMEVLGIALRFRRTLPSLESLREKVEQLVVCVSACCQVCVHCCLFCRKREIMNKVQLCNNCIIVVLSHKFLSL